VITRCFAGEEVRGEEDEGVRFGWFVDVMDGDGMTTHLPDRSSGRGNGVLGSVHDDDVWFGVGGRW
jgi:hypothetical protein